MRKIKEIINKFFPAESFRKNVATVFSGTVASQAIYLLFYPILTRIYTASQFGQYAIFLSFLSILGVVATGQYELPILLPKKEKNLKDLVNGAMLLSVFTSIILTVVLLIAFPLLNRLDYFESRSVVLFLGISVFVFTWHQIGFYLTLRKKDFKLLAFINILDVAVSIIFQYLFSRIGLKGLGLMAGYMIGTLISTVLFFLKNKEMMKFGKELRKRFSDIKGQFIRYKKFPIFNLPAIFVNLLANQSPQLLLNTFGQSVVGQFALSQRVLGSPVTLFSTAVSHVFKERASRDYRTKGSCRGIFVATLKSLALIAIIPFTILFFTAPTIIPIIFGDEWQTAGIYIRALSFMYFFKFTVSPLTYVIVVTEKQQLNLIFQTLLLVITGSAVYLGVYLDDPLTSVISFSISYSLIYLLFLYISYKLTVKDEKNN